MHFLNNSMKKFGALMLATLCIIMFISTVNAHADDDDDTPASAFSTVVRDVASNPSKYNLEGDKSSRFQGNQWGMLAAGNSFFSIANKNDFTLSYDNLYNSDNTRANAQGDAATYGKALSNLGLDHSMKTGLGNENFVSFGRIIGGTVTLVGYGLDSLVDKVFSMLGYLLSKINIMSWIAQSPQQSHDAAFIVPLHNIVYGMYKTLSDVGLVIASICLMAAIGMSIMGFRMSNSTPQSSTRTGILVATLKWAFRLIAMFVLPVVAVGIFASMAAQVTTLYEAGENSAANYAVYSNLFDFGRWSEHSRLALPSEVDSQIYAGRNEKADSQKPLNHGQILAMNGKGSNIAQAQNASTMYAGADSSLITSKDGKKGAASATKNSQTNKPGLNTILGWFGSSQYTASNYGSYVVANLPDSFTSKQKKLTKNALVKALESDSDKDANYIHNGKLQVKGKGDNVLYTMGGSGNNSKYTSSATQADANGGLSTVGMYNYLLSVFDDNSMEWIEAGKLTTPFTAPYHSQVGLVGRGMVGIGNFINMQGTLWSLGILGLLSAIFLIFTIIGSIPRLTSYAFGATASIKYASKLAAGILIFVVEVVGSGILYQLSREIIISISKMVDVISTGSTTSTQSIVNNLGGHSSAISGTSNSLLYALTNAFGGVLMIALAVYLAKRIKPIISVFTKIIQEALDKVLGALDNFGGGNNGLARAGREAGAAAPTAQGVGGGGSPDGDGGYAAGGGDGYRTPVGGVGGAGGRTPSGRRQQRRAQGQQAQRAREQAMGRPMTGAEAMRFQAGRRAKQAMGEGLDKVGANTGFNSLSNKGRDISDNIKEREGLENDKIRETTNARDKYQDTNAGDINPSAFGAKDTMTNSDTASIDEALRQPDESFDSQSHAASDLSSDASEGQVVQGDSFDNGVNNDNNSNSEVNDIKNADESSNLASESALQSASDNQSDTLDKGSVVDNSSVSSNSKDYQTADGSSHVSNGASQFSNTNNTNNSGVSSAAHGNQNFRSAIAQKRNAENALRNASPEQGAAAQQQLKKAESNLGAVRLKNIAYEGSKPVSSSYVKNGASVTKKQAYNATNALASSYKQISQAQKVGDVDKANRIANTSLKAAKAQASSIGLKSSYISNPKEIYQNANNMRQSFLDASNGKLTD